MFGVLRATWPPKFNEVIEDAQTPLMVGPGAVGREEVDNVGHDFIEEGEELVAVSNKQRVDYVRHLTEGKGVLVVFIEQLLLYNLRTSIVIIKKLICSIY